MRCWGISGSSLSIRPGSFSSSCSWCARNPPSARSVEFLGRPSTGVGRMLLAAVPAVAAVVIVDSVAVLIPFITRSRGRRTSTSPSTDGFRAFTTSLTAFACTCWRTRSLIGAAQRGSKSKLVLSPITVVPGMLCNGTTTHLQFCLCRQGPSALRAPRPDQRRKHALNGWHSGEGRRSGRNSVCW